MSLEVGLELVDAAHDAPAVDLELGLARTRGCRCRRACWLSVLPLPAQPRQAVAELRQLDLHLALLAVRVLGEDVEDQRGAVDRRRPSSFSRLRCCAGRQLVVEDHGVDVERRRDSSRSSSALPLPM